MAVKVPPKAGATETRALPGNFLTIEGALCPILALSPARADGTPIPKSGQSQARGQPGRRGENEQHHRRRNRRLD